MPVLHEQIARSLRDGIEDGTYPPGSKLPPISQLMPEWDASLETVRTAITRLAHEGLVTPLRGVGTIVRNRTPLALDARPGHTAVVWADQAGTGSHERLVTVERSTVTRELAARLEVPEGTDVVYRYRYLFQGNAVAQIVHQWIPGPTAAGIAEATGVDVAVELDTDLFTVLRNAGEQPATITETFMARMPSPEETDTLELPPGVPVLITLRTTRNSASIPIEAATFIGAGDRMSNSLTVPVG